MISINKYITEAMGPKEAAALADYNKKKDDADKALKVGDALEKLNRVKLDAETFKSKMAAKNINM